MRTAPATGYGRSVRVTNRAARPRRAATSASRVASDPGRPAPDPGPYRSLHFHARPCAIYRWEGPYLREWVAFHRLMGVERFFLYDNRSDDEHRDALAPYLEDGTVELREWPEFPGQVQAYTDCIARHRDDSRWIAFVDIDEFLFSPTGRPLPEVLARYERWAGVGVNRVTFGTSGHETRPPGLVLENYTRRIDLPEPGKSASRASSIPAASSGRSARTTSSSRRGRLVDEAEHPLDAHLRDSPSCATCCA